MFFEKFRKRQADNQVSPPTNLPGFLVKPSDPISQMMYKGDLTQVTNEQCAYSIEINEKYQNKNPYIIRGGTFEIDETHIYSKEGIPSWYAIKILKAPSMRTSALAGAVEQPYRLSMMMNAPDIVVMLPKDREINEYETFYLKKLGAWPEYDRIKGLDESQVFVHAFRMNGTIYKQYMLCARKGDFGWRLDCYIESQTGTEISPVDFVPPGYLFGGFKPL